MTTVIMVSDVSCPECAFVQSVEMAESGWQILYLCPQCGEQLRPRDGDCCVFCSFGSVSCPDVQRQERMAQ